MGSSSVVGEGDVSMETKMQTEMLAMLAKTNAFFKSQQMRDPDLTTEEKKQIAREILYTKGPGQFLARFANYLLEKDVAYFESFKDDYQVNFYLEQMSKRFALQKNDKKLNIKIRNRRYEALKSLVTKGEYFSQKEMKKRNPLLFEQLVGQYLTNEEREQIESIDESDMRFTTILMDHIDRDYTQNLKRLQYELEMQELESEEEEDDDDDEQEEESSFKITNDEKLKFQEEFLRSMHHSFLEGRDEEFDYRTVDENPDYDSLDIRQQDEEASYFDSEEPTVMDQTSEVVDN